MIDGDVDIPAFCSFDTTAWAACWGSHLPQVPAAESYKIGTLVATMPDA